MRMIKGLTQSELAKGICTASLVSQCESDRAKPSYKTLAQFAERLETSLEQLISDVDMNLKFTSTQKMARAMVLSKEYATAIPLLHELLLAPPWAISRTEVLHDLADSYRQTGDLEQAETYYTELKDWAVLRQDSQTLTIVLLHIGEISMERKQYQLVFFLWLFVCFVLVLLVFFLVCVLLSF